jgi:glyoxylase-like metal-dependent hydrolase (beta-lactamase superfamily II)
MSNGKSLESNIKYRTYITLRESLSRDAPEGHGPLKAGCEYRYSRVCGRTDAVLVDTFLTIDSSKQLADWIASSGRNLTTIYITHAHGDLFLVSSQFWNGFRKQT